MRVRNVAIKRVIGVFHSSIIYTLINYRTIVKNKMASYGLNCDTTKGIDNFYYLPSLKCCYFRFVTSSRVCIFSITGYTDPFSIVTAHYGPDLIEKIIRKRMLEKIDTSIKGSYKCILTETGDRQYRISSFLKIYKQYFT